MSHAAPPEGYRPCVGVMLLNTDRQVFVGERLDTPGAWQMPQGGIDPGEAPLEAAVRELREETGVTDATLVAVSREWLCYDLPAELTRKAWRGRYRGQAQIWTAFRFSGRDTDIDLEAHDAEFARFKWTDTASLLAEIVPFKRDVYRAVLKEFSAHLS